MIVLGINDGHNAAACLYRDGRVVAALQEERLRRVKNWSGLPMEAIDQVLAIGNVKLADVDYVAMNGHHASAPMTREQLMEEYRTINDAVVSVRRAARRSVKKVLYATPVGARLSAQKQDQRAAGLVARGVSPDKFVFVEHHTGHAAAAYYGWARFDEDILVLTCDGSGDGLCATVSIGRDGRLTRIAEVTQDNSLGNIYAMVTYLMGMVPLEHEYKLMGLAPYSDPKGVDQVFKRLRSLVRFTPGNPLTWERQNGLPETYCSYQFFREFFERTRFDAIAGGLQKFVEVMLTEWVTNCVNATGIRKVALGGGIFMNVKANKLIMELPDVQDLFVYPSCGDETNAMGAAYHVYAEKAGPARMQPIGDFYCGPSFTNDEVEAALRAYKFTHPVKFTKIETIERSVAELLAKGTVVARFRGREEFGARSLGNRAILSNPTDPAAVRLINEAIKCRDFWMPFCPSMLEERADDFIVNPKRVAAPYMILSFDTTERWKDIPAAIHPFDRTARPQLVSAKWNPSYHRVISEFEKLTGVGAVLNTSFNLHGFPICSRPADALEVLDKSGLTHLAIENWLVEKV